MLNDEDNCTLCAELLRWFRSYFADVRNFAIASITPDTRFAEDLGVDSLDYIDWVLEAERVFDVKISQRDAERMRTVRDYLSHLFRAGARWLPHQDIKIIKQRWGLRDWKVVDHGGETSGNH